MLCSECGALSKYSHLSCDMHAATTSSKLAFEMVARIKMRVFGEMIECHEDSGLSWMTRRIAVMAMRHDTLRSTLASSHHHQSPSPSTQDPLCFFLKDGVETLVFESEHSRLWVGRENLDGWLKRRSSSSC
jgi:hypothetical protein